MRNHAQYCRLPHRICTCKFFSAEICIHIPIFPHYISPRILNMTTHILDQKTLSTWIHFIQGCAILPVGSMGAFSIIHCPKFDYLDHLMLAPFKILCSFNISQHLFTILLLAGFETLFIGDLNSKCTNTRVNLTTFCILHMTDHLADLLGINYDSIIGQMGNIAHH